MPLNELISLINSGEWLRFKWVICYLIFCRQKHFIYKIEKPITKHYISVNPYGAAQPAVSMKQGIAFRNFIVML